MLNNKKYTTYFPLFFIIGAGVIKVGFSDLPVWAFIWKNIFLICSYIIGLYIFLYLHKNGRSMFGIFAMFFWLFNRWTLFVVYIGHIDFLALLFFLFSFYIISKRPRTAMLLFSISLALKQIAIFALPPMIYWASIMEFNNKPGSKSQQGWKPLIKPAIIMSSIASSIVGIACLPFLLDDPLALIKSIIFSSTRVPIVESQEIFGIMRACALSGRGIFLSFLFFTWIISIIKKLTLSESIFCSLFVFVGFNPVFFSQYFIWIIPFLFFAINDRIQILHSQNISDTQNGLNSY